MHAIAKLGIKRNVIGYCGLAENMVSGDSYKLGDVIKTRNGKTIEILNTDAEGRVVLADTLDVAIESKPAAMVDLATLTGACLVALGKEVAGLMTNDQTVCDAVAHAANARAKTQSGNCRCLNFTRRRSKANGRHATFGERALGGANHQPRSFRELLWAYAVESTSYCWTCVCRRASGSSRRRSDRRPCAVAGSLDRNSQLSSDSCYFVAPGQNFFQPPPEPAAAAASSPVSSVVVWPWIFAAKSRMACVIAALGAWVINGTPLLRTSTIVR
ncbi:UNVERIFIED_CONTAM: hypothetical protein GTU68_010473 [Idotea baltica]|nr:hypothetical protein [Idotea baltica]